MEVLTIGRLLEYLFSLGGWSLFIVAIIFYLSYPEKAQIFASHIYKIIGFLGAVVQKKAISSDIEGRCASLSKKINLETPGLLPSRVSVEWVEPDTVEPESFVKNGQVIMRMSYYKDQGRNLANAIHLLVQKHQLNEVKPYVEENLRKSIDLRVTQRCLKISKSKEALDYFVQNMLMKEIGFPPVQALYQEIEAIDQHGFFTRVMLVEFMRMAAEIYPEKAGLPEILKETEDFLHFLNKFPERVPGEEIELDFVREHIKVGFIIVAKKETLEKAGHEPYISRVENMLTGPCNAVYLCALNGLRPDAELVSIVVEQLLGVRVAAKHNYRIKYHGRMRNAICIRLELKARVSHT